MEEGPLQVLQGEHGRDHRREYLTEETRGCESVTKEMGRGAHSLDILMSYTHMVLVEVFHSACDFQKLAVL